MGTLALESLEIRNFRTFQHLGIPRLGRVNLFVGKNGVGKSSLLEALWLYAERGSLRVIWDVLRARDETGPPRHDNGTDEQALTALRYLFNSRKQINISTQPIQVGPLDAPDKTLTIAIGWTRQVLDAQGKPYLENVDHLTNNHMDILIPFLRIQYGASMTSLSPSFVNHAREVTFNGPESKDSSNVFVPAYGLTRSVVSALWDATVLTDAEEQVIKALQIVAPSVQRVAVTGDELNGTDPVPRVRVAGSETPVPLRSLGEGMTRLFGLALAAVNAKDGMLLVDEIESGIHYSIQADVWRLLFDIAGRLNVQVFATTHSWDTVVGLQQAAAEHPQDDGLVIRLQTRRDTIVPIFFDEHDLAIATRDEIEVR